VCRHACKCIASENQYRHRRNTGLTAVGFNELVNTGARQQMQLLGAVACQYYGQAAEPVATIVVIDRDVEVVSDNGLVMQKKTMLALWRQDVGKVMRGNRVIVGAEEF